MKHARFFIIALLSVSLLGLELIWTRIFSAEYFYAFAFLTLSFAVLGLGLGALALRLLHSVNLRGMMGIILTLTGLMALIGPAAVIQLKLDFTQIFSDWAMLGKFVLTIGLLSSSFFLGGIVLAMLFKQYHDDMPRLYMADLLGAGIGVVLSVVLMNHLGTPVAAFVIAVPALLAAMLSCTKLLKLIPAALIVGVFLMTPRAESLLEPEREERAPIIYKHWDAMAKLKMYDFGGHYRGLNIDNVANSPVIPFDGNYEDLDTTDTDWNINVAYLCNLFDSCTFLSLGAGAGSDVLQALDHQATEIHAVEVIPHINKMMMYGDTTGYIDFEPDSTASPEPEVAQADNTSETTSESDSTTGNDTTSTRPEIADTSDTDSTESEQAAEQQQQPQPPPMPTPVIRDSLGNIITVAEYTGHIYSDPRVRVVSEDARTYVKRFRNKFDVIYSLSSNTWAALGSGSFALAENYIFTTEAFIDYWNCLSDSGFLSMEHQVYMPRLVTEVKDALKAVGVDDIYSHFAIYNLPTMRRKLLLFSKRPLTDSLLYYAYGPLTPERYSHIHLLYPAPDSTADNIINRIVLEGWEAVQDTVPLDLSPCTDNRPFVAQLGQWKNFGWDKLDKLNIYADFTGFPLSKMIIVIILIVVMAIIIPLNLIPFLTSSQKLRAVPWLYFFVIGMGFMMLEVVLIQKYALFIGASVYSIATVLLTLLIASGIGSRFARRIGDSVAFIGILIWLLLDILVLGHITGSLDGLTVFPRVLITAALIFPLGFFMGMPFPKGTLRVGELIDWGFAVNGAASVLGATLIVMIAFSFGFTVALIVGGLTYLLAYGLISAKSAW